MQRLVFQSSLSKPHSVALKQNILAICNSATFDRSGDPTVQLLWQGQDSHFLSSSSENDPCSTDAVGQADMCNNKW